MKTILAIVMLCSHFTLAHAEIGTSKSEVGILSIRPCSINISPDLCGYFVGENHVNVPDPTPRKLQSKLDDNLDANVCAYVNDDNVLSDIAPTPCAL